MDQFVQIVRDTIDKRGLTVRQVADDAGIGYPYLYRVLKGEHSPTMDRAQKIADALGLSVTIKAKSEKITA